MVNDFSIELEAGEICAFVGESGTGKSTLLKLIAGLESVNKGEITIDGVLVEGPGVFINTEYRKVGFLFQEFALFPHMTVSRNIAYGLSKDERKGPKVMEMLELVGLAGYDDRYPHELSGGEQQRVALARALAPNPTLLLLDEPFSNLDRSLKTRLRAEMFRIIRSTGVSVILVTHDIEDAATEADQIVMMHQGTIVQTDSPLNLYNKPVSLMAAQLFGTVNLLEAEDISLFGLNLNHKGAIGIRAEHIKVSKNQSVDYVPAEVLRCDFMGGELNLTVLLATQNELIVKTSQLESVKEGKVYLNLPTEKMLLFQTTFS